MKFNIFGMWEIIYKRIILLIVIGVTIGGIACYFKFNRNSDASFIISVVYALLLFEMGIYYNYMNNLVNEKFYDRKDYYLNLLKLKSLFKNMNLENYTDEDILNSIIHFKTFTSRTDGMQNITPFIPQYGFKFKYNKLKIEDIFIEKRSDLLNKLNNDIIHYIDENTIAKKVPYPRIDNIFFNVQEWCDKHCELNETELKNIEIYISNILLDSKMVISQFEKIMRNIAKYYSSFKKKIEWNIKEIEHTYGQKLEYELNREEQYIIKLDLIIQQIEKLTNTMFSYEEVKELEKSISNDIGSLHEEIQRLKDDLTDEINAVTEGLIDNY